ncbi:NAD(P)/FAD-dependent oxidoreductase [Pseudolysinimonas sp.]|uniref:NAD(P)/FAD-dependent oxidoreductase n=1 Tax=Pseudolysinimonas sp. TaxID=2680009 RepID=UPI003F809A9D
MERILIIGGGYAGLYTALGLEHRLRAGEAEVTVLDSRAYMTYQPFLPELTAGSIEPRHLAVSLRRHLRRTRIVRGDLERLDHAHRTARIRTIDGGRRELGYDQVVVTAGATTRTFPIPGLERHAIGMRTIEEAVEVHDRLVESVDRAVALPAGAERRRLLTVTVVGGGFSGVEVTGELHSFAVSLLRRYREIRPDELRFHLVEATGRILPEVTDRPGRWVVEHFEERGIRVHLDTQVRSLEGGTVELSTGERFDSGIVVWTAGNAANPVIARHTDLPIDARGAVVVRPDLRVGTGEQPVDGAWAAGDAAAVPDLAGDPARRTVPNAQHAVRQGKRLARNIVAALRDEEPTPYRHASLGVVATLGMGDGIFQYHGLVIRGLAAWLMHRGYHVLAIPTMERKVRVLALWIVAFFAGRDIVALPSLRDPHAAFAAANRREEEPATRR